MTSDTIAALRAFLLSVLPAGVEVVLAQDNRVPEPVAEDFVVMTPLLRDRLARNTVTYTDNGPGGIQARHAKQPTQVTMQLDVHGPNSSNTVQIVTTLFTDSYGCDAFMASGFEVQPLYCSGPRQVPFLNESKQIESRWTLDAVMQANPVVTSAQEFAGELSVVPSSVDAEFPPA